MEKLKTFSMREWDVFQELRLGKTNKQIGAVLGIAEKTVKASITGILKKTQLDNRTQAALLKEEHYAHLIPTIQHDRRMKPRPDPVDYTPEAPLL